MSDCDCSNYIDCKASSVQMGTTSPDTAYGHTVNNPVSSSNGLFPFYWKTSRTFKVNYGSSVPLGVKYFLSGCSDDGSLSQCGVPINVMYHAVCVEDCTIESNVPYYFDRQRGIYIWKYTKETLSFNVTSDKVALFKVKGGNVALNKICIPTSVKTHGTEQFIMVQNGVKTVLATATYSYNPFPASDGGGATWGLYGNTVTRTATPDTPDVACILIFPTVGAQAIPLDPDVIAYGFYDYNATDGGFTVSSLASDDGGEDYFYPYWCRQMPTDPLWRQVADIRFGVISSADASDPTKQINEAGTTPWVPAAPTYYQWPCGSFAIDPVGDTVGSFILQFSDKAGGGGVVFNQSSFADLDKGLTKNNITLGAFTSFLPVAPL